LNSLTFISDEEYTPFVFNTELKFYVTAYNDYGESGLSEAITIRDRTQPIFYALQEGSADNSNNPTNSKTVQVKVSAVSGEFLDNSKTPTYTISGQGGANEYVIPLTDVSIDWSDDLKTMILNLNIPKGKTAVGNVLFITDIYDTSGNKQKSPLIYILQ